MSSVIIVIAVCLYLGHQLYMTSSKTFWISDLKWVDLLLEKLINLSYLKLMLPLPIPMLALAICCSIFIPNLSASLYSAYAYIIGSSIFICYIYI